MDSSRDIVRKLRENRILQERADYNSKDRDELIKLAKEGDQLAITTLINTHQDFLKRMSKKYFTSTGDQDDIMQTINIAFWNAIMSWDGSGDFEAYAGMIIKRKLTDMIRSEGAGKTEINTGADSLDRTVQKNNNGGPGDATEITLGDMTPDKRLSPEEEYIGGDGYNKIMEFMKSELSDAELRAILRYIDGYKVSEIADIEDMKYKAAENAIRRAKWKIAEYVKSTQDESKEVDLDESITFTEEEKSILRKVINDILGETAVR